MAEARGRYPVAYEPRVADGWRLQRLTPPSRLFGANGLRTGPDGKIYVAQVSGSQISAIDPLSGRVETISPLGSAIVAPDDVAFDSSGTLYATEVMDGRVTALNGGKSRVLRDDVPFANGITVHQDRLFVGECRIGGRLLELDLNGGAPRVLLDDVPMPNAMEIGPDGMLYFPVMAANEIWRINPEGGAPAKVAGDLGVPDAVKFDAQGFIVSTQAHTGEVLRIDPRTGERTVLATLDPGLDNLTFVGDRLFVSNFTGEITEVMPGGSRALLPGGLNWPLDLAAGPEGNLYVADGTNLYELRADGQLQRLGMLFTPGYPGFVRGLAPSAPGELIVTTSGGQIARYQPAQAEHEVLADGFDQLYGVAIGPNGTIVAAEFGAGRVIAVSAGKVEVLASGLQSPVGVAFMADGTSLVAEAGAGRVVKIKGGATTDTVIDGLDRPQGILVRGDLLYIVDAGAKSVLTYDMRTHTRSTLAADLPIGPPPGVTPKPLQGLPPYSGPQGPFAGITAGADGTLYISADGDGSIFALRPEQC